VVGQASSTVPKNTVISSNPPEGNNEPANTVVTLYVSSGAGPVSVPNEVGQQATAAEAALQAAGFKVVPSSDATSTAAAGTVLSQSPSGGTALPGSTVTITVSGGAVPVTSVIGDSQATATSILTNDGFQVVVTPGTGSNQYAAGMVFAQQPSSGNAQKGSKVTIYVQTAPTAPASSTATATPTDGGSAPPP
jgi:eukaryotic-like serine/threonine-protein kinase